MRYKIEMLETVCCVVGQKVFNKGDVLTVETESDMGGPNFNGATMVIEGYPFKKFFHWDEFIITENLGK